MYSQYVCVCVGGGGHDLDTYQTVNLFFLLSIIISFTEYRGTARSENIGSFQHLTNGLS